MPSVSPPRRRRRRGRPPLLPHTEEEDAEENGKEGGARQQVADGIPSCLSAWWAPRREQEEDGDGRSTPQRRWRRSEAQGRGRCIHWSRPPHCQAQRREQGRIATGGKQRGDFFFFFDRAARGEKLGKDSGVQTPEIGEGLDCAVFQKNPLVFYFLQRNPFSWFSAS